MELGRECNVKYNIYSPAPCPPQSHFAQIAPLIDICIPNRTEALELGGNGDLTEAAKNIRELGVKNVLITLGGDGFGVLPDGGEFKTFPLEHKVKVVDTTGAGDSFSGALAHSLNTGKLQNLVDHAFFASHIASLSVTKNGTQKSYPSRRDI